MQTIIIIPLITAGLCFTASAAFGQTFSEWWLQKRTRIKYLHQQADILDALKETIEEGYEVAGEWVDSIGNIAEEEFKTHEKFLKSLPFVKPPLKNNPDLLFSYALAKNLIVKLMETMTTLRQDSELTEFDVQWLAAYMKGMAIDMKDNLAEMEMLTSDGAVAMKDSERYRKIRATSLNIRAAYEAGMCFLIHLDELHAVLQENANDAYIKRNL